jgi:hypothetical protein
MIINLQERREIMWGSEIPENTIEIVAKYINQKNNQPSSISVIGNEKNSESPHYFEIIPFEEIDNSEVKFYAIDGSYNSEEFYNGLSIGVYAAGYLCIHKGRQVRMNNLDDPLILGKAYYPNNILVTKDEDMFHIFDELLSMEPVKKLIEFFGDDIEEILGFGKNARKTICSNFSRLLSFAQNLLEWSLIFEICNRDEISTGDIILKDGTLRTPEIKLNYLIKLGEFIKSKGIIIVGITKKSPIKMELSYTFKEIDNYLQNKLKPMYPFKVKEIKKQKLCCWFEVPSSILDSAYGEMYAKKSIKGSRGFGLFFAARLDYVEKLQNYDWLIADINIFDAIPNINNGEEARDIKKLKNVFNELTRLTQEHYILGYPFPLVEVHNFISLKKEFKDEIIKRVKFALYKEQFMDNVDIENLFLDIHDRF